MGDGDAECFTYWAVKREFVKSKQRHFCQLIILTDLRSLSQTFIHGLEDDFFFFFCIEKIKINNFNIIIFLIFKNTFFLTNHERLTYRFHYDWCNYLFRKKWFVTNDCVHKEQKHKTKCLVRFTSNRIDWTKHGGQIRRSPNIYQSSRRSRFNKVNLHRRCYCFCKTSIDSIMAMAMINEFGV